ncbi:MAG: substrate-binding domain-containing protein [Chloroflexi bacterium]|nr:substrate-binding domain-containing protein [Chloroflexota bacterium]
MLAITALGVIACSGDRDTEVILATTTSTQDSGLLDVLIPMFEQDTEYEVKVIAVGSGAALAMARSGDADVLLTHSPAAEEQLVTDGFGLRRARVMYNDFVIVGPPNDPAGIAGLASVTEAFAQIAEAGAPFVSRGDDSGTHAMEKALWAAAGLEVPAGQSWYAEAGQGMGAVLTISRETGAYTLSDRGTWLSTADADLLPIRVEGDARLFNVYHVITVNPESFPNLTLNTPAADAFREFLLSDDAQEVITMFGIERFGQALFVPYPEE